MLIMIAICNFPVVAIAQVQEKASNNSGRFVRSDEIVIVTTEQGKTVTLLKAKVVGTNRNGFLKIYGEKFQNIDHKTWKVTFSASIRSSDISPEGIANTKDIRNTHLIRKEFDKDKEIIRQNRGRKKDSIIIPITGEEPSLYPQRPTYRKRHKRQRLRRHRRYRIFCRSGCA